MTRYVAQTPDELIDQDSTLSMSGLDFMKGMLEGRIAGPPMAAALNYQITEVSEGRAVFRGAPKFEFVNPTGAVHGGWYGTLLDSCMACAVMTAVPKGAIYTTLEYKVNIVRPIKLGVQVDAIGILQHAGRSTGVATGEIRGVEDGKLYATGSTTCIIMQIR